MKRLLGRYHLILSLLCFYYGGSKATLESQFDHSAWLDPSENYRLHWTVDHKDKSITFAAEVKTTGWIGFGISKGLTGNMEGADIAMGWIDGSGKGHILDCYGVGNTRPKLDEKQDFQLLATSRNSTLTTLRFKRKIDTCDKQDNPIKPVTTKVIYAWSDTRPTGAIGISSLNYHKSNRGSRSLSLLNYVKNAPISADAKSFDVLQKNLRIPGKPTTYWCTPYRLSDLVNINSTHHIIEIAPVIQKRAENLVHHMVLYGCDDSFDPAHLSSTGECYGGNLKSSVQKCAGESSIYAWAIGGTAFKFPKDVGFPIGGKMDYKYVVIETHFDNPQSRSDFVDTSGLRLYYTKPRKHSASMLTVGSMVNSNMLIPPKMNSWVNTGICPSQCTEKIKTEDGGNTINIFSSFPHAHYAGRAIRTVMARNGTATAEIIHDDNYDFNFQQTYLLDKFIKLKAGDELFTFCNYSTAKRNYASVGGLGTLDEMCLNFMMYYPRVNLTDCKSDDSLVYYFSKKYGKPKWRPGLNRSLPATWPITWDGVAWNDSMVTELKSDLNFSGQYSIDTKCVGPGSNYYNIPWLPKRPKISKQLPQKKNDCPKDPRGPSSQSYINRPNLSSMLAIIAASFAFNRFSL